MRIDHNVDVTRPITEVFEYWADLERSPEWAAPVIERRKLTDGPVGVGTRYRAVDRFPGRTVTFELEITEFVPQERMAAVWFEPMGGGWTATFAETDGGTQVALSASVEPTGVMKLLSPLLAPWVRRQMGRDLAAFKARVESSAT